MNLHSREVTTEEFWSPDHNFVCSADGDDCPICSVKRDGTDSGFTNLESADYYGDKIYNTHNFIDFQQWMTSVVGLPHSIDNSYDPIWYLFHSFESYMQAMWVNCNNYDLININDLDFYPDAFSPYCDPDDDQTHMTENDCVGINLDDPLFISGLLPKRKWSYCHNNKLSIRKLYSLPQWNVLYDLNNNDFFIKSGLNKKFKNKINKEWFILTTDEKSKYNYKPIIIKSTVHQTWFQHLSYNNYQVVSIIIFIVLLFCVIITMLSKKKHKQQLKLSHAGYGSV